MKILPLLFAFALNAAAATSLPKPIYVVHPDGLPRDFLGATVRVALTLDAAGIPHDVTTADRVPRDVSACLLPAVAQWRFSPYRVGGVARPLRIVIPLRLVPGTIKPTTYADPSLAVAGR